MAAETPVHVITLIAAADLSAKQYYGVKVDSAGKAALAGAGDLCIGVLQNNPLAGQAATVMVLGRTKMVAGAAVAAGAVVKSDASGLAQTAVKGKTDSTVSSATDPLLGSNCIGVCLEASAAANEVISLELLHLGAVPTTLS